MPGFRAARLATLLIVIFAAACGDGGGGTGLPTETEVTQNIDIPNVFAAQELASAGRTGAQFMSRAQAIEIRKIRVSVYEVPSNRLLFQKIYDVDPTLSKWTLPFTAPVGVQIRLVAELMSVSPSGVTKVEYSGQAGPLRLTPCPCTPIPVPTYPGPVDNLGATSVTLSAATLSMNEGQTGQLSATVLPAGPTYEQAWITSNSGVATVSASGVVTAVAPGTTQIIVVVGPRRDTAVVTVAAAPRTVAIQAGDAQTAAAGAAVTTPPSVIVRTAAGAPVAGVNVVFEVMTGGGSVTGATTTTNAQGIATVGSWVLGTTPGPNTLRATANGTTNGSVTFTATATVASTCVTTPHALGTSVNGTWTTSDCLAASGSGRRFDMYEFTITQQTSFRASVTGSTGRRLSLRRSGTQEYVQVMAGESFMSPTAPAVEARYVLAPGSYVFEIANQDAATLGTYTLTTAFDATASCSPLVFVMLGVTINEQLSASDCDGAFGGKEDWFIILPNAGQRVDLTLATSSFAPVLVFRDDRLGPASPTLARDIRTTVGETARIGYTTTFSGFHEIVVNNGSAALGSYTLTIGTGSTSNTCVPINTSVPSQRLAKWESTDCSAGGQLYDRYPFTLAAQTAVRGTLTGPVNKSLGVFAGGNEVLDWSRTAAGDLNAVWYLPAGQYEFRASIPAASADSAYTLVTAATNGDITCTNNATTGGVTFSNQSLGSGDCTFNNEYEDRMVLWVQAGKTISASMTANNFNPAIIIRDPAAPGGTVIVRNTRSSPGTVSGSHTVTTSGYYQVIFGAAAPGLTGTYSGSIGVN